jgi:hypothetical protein
MLMAGFQFLVRPPPTLCINIDRSGITRPPDHGLTVTATISSRAHEHDGAAVIVDIRECIVNR